MAAWPRASGVSVGWDGAVAVGRSKPNFESVFGQCSVWSHVTAKVKTEQNVAGALMRVTCVCKETSRDEDRERARGLSSRGRPERIGRVSIATQTSFCLSFCLGRPLVGREALPSFFSEVGCHTQRCPIVPQGM